MNVLGKIKPINYQTMINNLIFKKWTNELNQIDFISFLLNLNVGDLFSFKNAPKKIKKINEFISPVIEVFK